MADFTPSTMLLREGYFMVRGFTGMRVEIPILNAEFDRWLAEHDRQIAERILRWYVDRYPDEFSDGEVFVQYALEVLKQAPNDAPPRATADYCVHCAGPCVHPDLAEPSRAGGSDG